MEVKTNYSSTIIYDTPSYCKGIMLSEDTDSQAPINMLFGAHTEIPRRKLARRIFLANLHQRVEVYHPTTPILEFRRLDPPDEAKLMDWVYSLKHDELAEAIVERERWFREVPHETLWKLAFLRQYKDPQPV